MQYSINGQYGVIGNMMKPPYTTITSYDLNKGTIRWQTGFGDDPILAAQGIHGTGMTQMRNSVIARNGDEDCVISVTATLNLDRYNMDSDDTCELSSGSSNYPGVEPWLTPPMRRGGFTRVAWPLTRSPVIDQGHPVIGAIGCEAEDQDFNERPVDFDGDGNARCDVGAIELDDDVIFHDPMERL